VVTDGGAPSTLAGGVEAPFEVLLDLGLQRPLLLLRRTVLAARVPCEITTGSGAVGTTATATARWLLTLRIAWGVVRADAESAKENKTMHLLTEYMAI
jgi:hypothetical protein